ncbi:hypothetical protein TcWFU_002835 [Taenia crassiceps]|uniref:Uncharacterized protein n=1 Tax=Taenia crassiceps TaxID=6207 RepID=A0ABR4QAS6_9CEST
MSGIGERICCLEPGNVWTAGPVADLTDFLRPLHSLKETLQDAFRGVSEAQNPLLCAIQLCVASPAVGVSSFL